ncbi:ADA regulatory protein [Vibrio maritimus]|uniref:ADA regulatory protein n=1 Tax=Vibrio maritimus TaxID=990268 RepID=A0A090S0V6_9VIBR|nr:ADA regulatory protein [Vibrio maritimus]
MSGQLVFPTPAVVSNADLSFLRMPQSRKETLARLANYLREHCHDSPNNWLALKGIGPWTVNYALMRGQSEPDLFLSSDLIVKKYLKTNELMSEEGVSPWGSYATLHCWSHY